VGPGAHARTWHGGSGRCSTAPRRTCGQARQPVWWSALVRRSGGGPLSSLWSVGWGGGEAAVGGAGQPPAPLMDRRRQGRQPIGRPNRMYVRVHGGNLSTPQPNTSTNPRSGDNPSATPQPTPPGQQQAKEHWPRLASNLAGQSRLTRMVGRILVLKHRDQRPSRLRTAAGTSPRVGYAPRQGPGARSRLARARSGHYRALVPGACMGPDGRAPKARRVNRATGPATMPVRARGLTARPTVPATRTGPTPPEAPGARTNPPPPYSRLE
jgi:hypothetical protein